MGAAIGGGVLPRQFTGNKLNSPLPRSVSASTYYKLDVLARDLPISPRSVLTLPSNVRRLVGRSILCMSSRRQWRYKKIAE